MKDMKDREENFWKKRNVLVKILIVIIVLLLCIMLAAFIVLIMQFGRLAQSETTTCMTPQCVKAAAQIIDLIDPSVDPCDNFYDFVCGTFLRRSLGTNEITSISKLEAVTARQVDALISKPIAEPLPKSLRLQRKFYRSCMNTTAIEQDDYDTLLNLIEKLWGWPVLTGRFWNENKFDWLTSTIKLRKMGFEYEYFMKVTGKEDANGTGLFLLSISPPARTNLDEKFKESYIDLMTNIALEFGAYAPVVKNEFIRVLHFEEQIKNLTIDEEKYGQDVIVNVSTLQNEFPSIPWVDFLNNLTITSIPFNFSTLVHFRGMRYLPNLLNLVTIIPKSIQANYITWKIVEGFRHYLKENIRARYNLFLMSLNPFLAFNNSRKAFCLNQAKFYFPSVAELAYVKKYMWSKKRLDIKEIIQKIRHQLATTVSASEWMDEKSKELTRIKIDGIKDYVGCLDNAFQDDFDKIVELEGLNLATDNVIEMITKLQAKKADNYFNVINRNYSDVIEMTLESSPILDINAMYATEFKTLVLPASLLQDIIYNYERPRYMNYGALGSMIGHEFTHSIFKGNRSKDTEQFWTPQTVEKFEKKNQCLLEEYQNYTEHLEGFTKDGGAALEENIADFVGPNLAYKAYQEWVESHGKEKKLPGLDYDPKQIFWIMSAAFKCYQPALRDPSSTDMEHGVPSFAVVASLRNSPDFATDFNCSIGTNMNPEKKCRIL